MPRARYTVPVEVLLHRGDAYLVLVPTRDGETCITVSPEFVVDGRLTVQPIRRDGEYVVAHTPTRLKKGRREPVARQWIPAGLVREEVALRQRVVTARKEALAQFELPGVPGVWERQEPRYPAPALVAAGPCVIRDISRSGIGLVYEVSLAPGDRYRIVLTDILLGETESLRLEAVWCRSGRAGLRWVSLDDAQRCWLARYLGDQATG